MNSSRNIIPAKLVPGPLGERESRRLNSKSVLNLPGFRVAACGLARNDEGWNVICSSCDCPKPYILSRELEQRA